MKPTDRGNSTPSPERSTVESWVDVARRGDPDAAETRRARMLVASHREAKLESTLMADFDAARAPREGDEKIVDDVVAKVMVARMRRSSERLRPPSAADRLRVETERAEAEARRRAEEERALAEGPRVANAIATPGPQQALQIERKPLRGVGLARVAGTLSAGIALGALIAFVAVEGFGVRIARDPDHGATPRSAAIDARREPREAPPPPRDPREVAVEEALAILEVESGDHASSRRLEGARRLIERGELARATRVLRSVSRRWPRRSEANAATLALGHVYLALGWPRSAERVWSRWVRQHPHERHALDIRARLTELASTSSSAIEGDDEGR
ncbi:tetratricopeptide repeat protein [Sandaracinus amylolyticus]|uniref:tetratricopeptide repeat protein n=1 Tax=Sandaracinus amylolyticus TaxID=927083 RepID=UPI001F422F65|nr:hypothetical protein [Sandaracinus amylolyticus]UJR85411.1 Hypothetical protein I5071_74910 [Sandaracinus amylolyticus]